MATKPKGRAGPAPPELVIRDAPPKSGAAADRSWRPWICPDVDLGATAANLGISASHLSYIVNGSRRPSMQVAKRIAVMLGLSLDEIEGAIDRGNISQVFNRIARERRKQNSAGRKRERRQAAEPDSEGEGNSRHRGSSFGLAIA